HVGRRPASVDSAVAALRPAELLERLAECSDPSLSFRVALSIGHQHAYTAAPFGLLRARRERPRRRAGDERDELAALHSITSSARTSTPCGTVMPSAFAVLRLMTISYLVGACTGSSSGFSPLRMRSTEP